MDDVAAVQQLQCLQHLNGEPVDKLQGEPLELVQLQELVEVHVQQLECDALA